jgi:hypothetical protein
MLTSTVERDRHIASALAFKLEDKMGDGSHNLLYGRPVPSLHRRDTGIARTLASFVERPFMDAMHVWR